MSPAGNQADFTFTMDQLTINDLGVVSVKVEEYISKPFYMRLDLACTDANLDLNAYIGKAACLHILGPDKTQDRFINGVVSSIEYTNQGSRFARYEVEVVPFLWMLDLRQKSRIFQDMSVPQIVSKVLEDAGMKPDSYQQHLQRTCPPRVYCVQYRESDLDFVHRLMEEEGIFYFFEHTETSHLMIMADAPSIHKPIAGKPTIVFRHASGMNQAEDFISNFRLWHEVRSGAVMTRDYKFETPKVKMEAKTKADRDDALEIYDYPGEYQDNGVGAALAKIRLEEQQAKRCQVRLVSMCHRMQPGHLFTLADHFREELNAQYLITRVVHRANQPQVLAEEPEATLPNGPLYENIVHAIPSTVPYRPPRNTPRPFVHGTQTATVVGPSGEEIYTDKYGRVKVKFHWDREGKYDEKASCWIRVSQTWAGGQYGSFYLPRIAHEVIVDFLEGDPDQPIIVGTVYNGEEMPPYALPDKKVISTLRTASSKGQGGANELRFDDTNAKEQIFIHAQYDFHERVKHDSCVNIENDSSVEVTKNFMEKIGGDSSLDVGGNWSISVGKQLSTKVKADVITQIDGAHKEKVAGNYYVKANQILLEAPSICLKSGGNFVVVDASGVTIKGTMVLINSGGSALSDSAPAPTGPSAPQPANTGEHGKDTSYSDTPVPNLKQAPPVQEKLHWLGIELKDDDDKPVPGEAYRLRGPDGKILDGTLDANGKSEHGGLKPGSYHVNFPNRMPDEWHKA